MKIFVINLDRDVERLEFMSSQLDYFKINYFRAAAVDGKKLSDEQFDKFCRDSPSKYDKGTKGAPRWERGSVGCFLSHYNVWKTIAEGTDRFAVVFEDDIHLSSRLTDILKSDVWIPDYIGIIRLEAPSNRVLLDKSDNLEVYSNTLFRLKSTAWLSGGYIIRKDVAEMLISAPQKCFLATDYYIFSQQYSPFFSKLNIYQFSPALCIQNKFTARKFFDSNIDKNEIAVIDNLNSALSFFKMEKIINTLRGFRRVHFID